MTSSQKFARPPLYGSTPLAAAISKFVDLDKRSFIQDATIDEAIRNGAEKDDLTAQINEAEQTTSELQDQFEAVISTSSEELLDILKKLQLWSYVTNCNDPADDSFSPSERLVASAANDLQTLLKRADRR